MLDEDLKLLKAKLLDLLKDPVFKPLCKEYPFILDVSNIEDYDDYIKYNNNLLEEIGFSLADILKIIKKSSKMSDVKKIFNVLGVLQEENIIPYNLPNNYKHLLRRSLFITLKFSVSLIILFYLIYFFNLMKIFYIYFS